MIPTHQLRFNATESSTQYARYQDAILSDLASHGATLLKGGNPTTEFSILDVARLLGDTELKVDKQLSGPTLMHLRYEAPKIQENQRPAYFTSDYFPLHTDLSYVEETPNFILMHCIFPDANGGGITLLSDCQASFHSDMVF